MVKIKDKHIWLGLSCLFVTICFLFIFLPLRLLHSQKCVFDDLSTSLSYKFFSKKIALEDILIIKIDDGSIKKLGIKWPWPRRQFALLIEKIAQYNPAVIVFDVVFTGESAIGKEDDFVFANSIKESKNIVLASYISENREHILPYAPLANSARAVGFVNKVKDKDSTIRRARAVAEFQGILDYSLELKAIALFLGVEPESLELKNLKIISSNKNFPSVKVDSDGTVPMKYSFKFQDIKTIPVIDVLERDLPKEIFKDKFILIGQTANILHDVSLTPLGHMPGSGVLANFAYQILTGSTPQPLSKILLFIILFFTGITIGFIGLSKSVLLSFLIALLMSISAIFISSFTYYKGILFDSFAVIFLATTMLLITWGYRFYVFIKKKNRLIRVAVSDGQTGLFNRHYFEVRLKDEALSAKFKKQNLSLIMVHIDNYDSILDDFDLKEINNFFGELVKRIKLNLPRSAFLARFSDDKIAVLLSKINNSQLRRLAKEINLATKNLIISSDGKANTKEVLINIGAYFQDRLNPKSALIIMHALMQATKRAKEEKEKLCIFTAPIGDEKIIIREKDHLQEQDELEFVTEDLFQRNRQLIKKIEELKGANKKTQQAYISTLRSLLEALEEKDPYTSGHSRRVRNYVLALAKQINLVQDRVDLLEKAALLHDIGKIGLPDNILHKKGQLTSQEIDIIKRHEITSVKILEPMDFLREVLPIIFHHHEHFDGGGYPHGLRGDMIPLESRIISVADSFDAMTTGRGYNKPLDRDEAIQALRSVSGKQLDPNLVEEFIKLINERKI